MGCRGCSGEFVDQLRASSEDLIDLAIAISQHYLKEQMSRFVAGRGALRLCEFHHRQCDNDGDRPADEQLGALFHILKRRQNPLEKGIFLLLLSIRLFCHLFGSPVTKTDFPYGLVLKDGLDSHTIEAIAPVQVTQLKQKRETDNLPL